MIKKIESSGNSETGQLGLDGKVVRNDMESLSREEREEIGFLKSALQKYVRRGLGERAAYVACQLSNKKTGWILWRRLNIIAVEDCLDATVILAVSELGRQAMKYGYDSWDGRRCAVAASLLMSESRKDNRADEFLELMDVAEKGTDDEELKAKMEDLARIEDYVHDQHTASGRRMGRGDLFWYEVSSETVHKTPEYEAWREQFFKPLMVRLAKEE
jgi:hypothetical protein